MCVSSRRADSAVVVSVLGRIESGSEMRDRERTWRAHAIEYARGIGRVVHFEIRCVDLDRAERFYSEVFGWRSIIGKEAPSTIG